VTFSRQTLGSTGIYEALSRPIALSFGFAQRMIGGRAAAHSACSVSVKELVATHTGSAAATSERAYELSAAKILGFMGGS